MTDDFNDKQPQPRRRRPAPDDAASPSGAGSTRDAFASPGSSADDDSLAALERLQSLTSATAAAPVAEAPRAAPRARRPISPAPHVSRPRPAAAPRAGRVVARIAAPAVFLVAVLILLSIVFQSGVIGGKAEPLVTPSPKAGKTKSGATAAPTNYKVYVIKSGDTMSGIAVKFHVATSDIEALNPKLSTSTLVVGTKIKVPKLTP